MPWASIPPLAQHSPRRTGVTLTSGSGSSPGRPCSSSEQPHSGRPVARVTLRQPVAGEGQAELPQRAEEQAQEAGPSEARGHHTPRQGRGSRSPLQFHSPTVCPQGGTCSPASGGGQTGLPRRSPDTWGLCLCFTFQRAQDRGQATGAGSLSLLKIKWKRPRHPASVQGCGRDSVNLWAMPVFK